MFTSDSGVYLGSSLGARQARPLILFPSAADHESSWEPVVGSVSDREGVARFTHLQVLGNNLYAIYIEHGGLLFPVSSDGSELDSGWEFLVGENEYWRIDLEARFCLNA